MAPKQKRQKPSEENDETPVEDNDQRSVSLGEVSAPASDITLAQRFLDIEDEQCDKLLKLQYGQGTLQVYNPLDYASQIHKDFVVKFCQSPKKVLLLGMNPGPWGMGQTGVPFGHVEYARDWLGVKGEVTKPANEHPKRPIEGLSCKRKEVSGERMWSLLQQLSGSPEVLFTNIFIHNYCPLYFLKDSAKNVTPPELKVAERGSMEDVCNKALVSVVDLLGIIHVVGVGNYAAQKARAALNKAGLEEVQVSTLMHPSPVNPAANKGWAEIAIKQLTESKIIDYFKPNV